MAENFENSYEYKMLDKLGDEELVKISCKNKNADSVLAARYVGIVKKYARGFSPASAETAEDFMQEGFLGLLEAIKTFNPKKNAKFRTYAGKCIKNRMISSMRKNMPQGGGDDFEDQLENVTDSDKIPEEIVIEKETGDELCEKIFSALSQYERNVFRLFLRGDSYRTIAEKTDSEEKSVNNAMQRVRQKLKVLLK